MNFENYSKQTFESCGLDTPAARQLAYQLQVAVVEEMQEAVLAALLRVVEGLNVAGHNLKPYEQIRAGDIAFRDESVDGQCRLRLACDIVISAGYSDTHTVDEIEAKNVDGSP